MKLTLHIGAHRTGSTSFQTYLRKHKQALAQQGVGFWGPVRLRRGLSEGIIARPLMRHPDRQFARALGRIKLHRAKSEARGITHVIVSEENILGTMRHNFACASLYPSAAERVAKFVQAFGPVSQIALSIRSLDSYWTSALTYSVIKGFPVATPQKIARLSGQSRNWREVICEIARAVPDTPIIVTPYERVASQPHHVVAHLTQVAAPAPTEMIWRNARPPLGKVMALPLDARERQQLASQTLAGKWAPIPPDVQAVLQERYLDDIFWLRAGADGLASFYEAPHTSQAKGHLPLGVMARGQDDDKGYRLARPG